MMHRLRSAPRLIAPLEAAAMVRGRATAAALPALLGAWLTPVHATAQTAQPESRTFAAGAVTKIDEFQDGSTLVEALQWGVPSLIVGRCPDGRLFIQIRGPTPDECPQPLVLIDGAPVTDVTMWLTSLQPWDVARIEVLRDVASTSVYGTRGANGVILIYLRRR